MRTEPAPWRTSFIVAVIATYSPYVFMAIGMVVFERQSDNKLAAIKLIPYGPVAGMYLLTAVFNTWMPHGMRWPSACLVSLVLGLLPAALGRLGREWLVGGAVTAFFIHAIAAYLLVGAIRA